MKKSNKTFYKFILLLLLCVGVACSSAKKTGDDLVADAQEEKTAITNEYPEMAEHFDSAAGYAVFPNVGKGAYVIGGASGNGAVYEDGDLIGYADLKQVDIGLQAGGKSFVEVLFFEDERVLEDFKDGSYDLSANASAVILEKGKSRNLNYNDGVAVVTMPKAGAMAGISVGGQRFSYRNK